MHPDEITLRRIYGALEEVLKDDAAWDRKRAKEIITDRRHAPYDGFVFQDLPEVCLLIATYISERRLSNERNRVIQIVKERMNYSENLHGKLDQSTVYLSEALEQIERPSKTIRYIVIAQNNMVCVFNDVGEQMPEYQGMCSEELMGRLKEAAPAGAFWEDFR